ncbi:MAG: CAP domain-containing protein [Microgenomates group bacterium]
MKWILILMAWVASWWNQKILDPQAGYDVKISNNQLPISKQIPSTNTQIPTKKVVPTVVKPIGASTFVDTTADKWGVANQIDEHTWTMRVAQDERMGTPAEILAALNDYRVRRGSQRLTWNDNLANYAQQRANYLNSIRTTDGHKGFADFLEKEDGYDKLGFTWLGENISYGYHMLGVHLIEWIYAGDKPHDDNQVNNRWNYVGIGVKGTATALIFGTGKR